MPNGLSYNTLMKATEDQMTATSLTLLWQALAFLIDMLVIIFPMFIYPSPWTMMSVMLMWLLYIPLAEYYYGRTLGMLAVGTRILGLDGGHVPYSAVRRRLVARFSMVWGVVGWLSLFMHLRIAEGYIILRKGETVQDLRL